MDYGQLARLKQELVEYSAGAETGSPATDYLATLLLGTPGQDYHSLPPPCVPKQAVLSIKQGVALTFGAVGSFAAGLHRPSELIRISMAGTPSQSTFYSFARSKLRACPDIVITSSDADGYTMFNIHLTKTSDLMQDTSIPMSIAYHQAPIEKLPGLWLALDDPNNVEWLPSVHYKARLKALHLREIFANSDRNKLWYHKTVAWACSQGLFSNLFSLLTGEHLIDMTAIAISMLPSSEDANDEDFVQAFCALEKLSPLQHDTYPIINAPYIDKISSRATIIREHLYPATVADAPPYFPIFTESSALFTVDISYWGLSKVKGGRLMNKIEMIVDNYLYRLTWHLYPSLRLRPWPQRMMRKSAKAGAKDGSYYEASYFVAALINDKTAVSDDVMSSIPVLLRDEITRNGLYDVKVAFVDAAWVAEPISAEDWEDDRTSWGPLPEERKPGTQDDDDDDDPSILDSEEGKPQQKKSSKSAKSHINTATHVDSESNSPLRPALDVLHRINNDHVIDSTDYVVGYLDRHAGIKEMPAEYWIVKEKTEEDFIPQSRIRYFKRISDGVTVWDRERRLDLLFGSGRKVASS